MAETVDAPTARDFSVYGLGLRIEGDWPQVTDSLAADLAWFRGGADAGSPEVVVSVARRRPELGRFAPVPQAFITTRNVVFQVGHQTIVDYGGRVLAVYDRGEQRFSVEGEDEHLVHEAAYLFLLSRIGRHLDDSGMTRVHALGLSGAQGGVLLLLPSGGGKTTLALRALRDPGVKLISEDTPVIDRRGKIHPFPLRIGVNESDAQLLPEGDVRRIERLEYGPKLLLSLERLGASIEDAAVPVRHIVVGRRWLNGGGALTPLPRRALIGPLLRDGVVGLGVAQMIEYVLREGARDFLGQGGVAASRARSCARAMAGARAWRLELGPDTDRNWKALGPLLA